MRFRFPHLRPVWIGTALVVLVVASAWGLSDWWVPPLRTWITGAAPPADRPVAAASDEDHDHGHAGHEESAALDLSPQARRNIGLEIGEVRLGDYNRAITVPAMVVERVGRTKVKVSAPLTGVVTGMSVIQGEAVQSGALLFTLRLTHEDLVAAQTEFLSTLGRLDVERREIARLEGVTSNGAVAGRVVLERKYERDKLEAALQAQREALLLHGLSQAQVEQIAQDRRLLRELKVFAPFLHEDSSLHDDAEEDVVAQVSAVPGEDSHAVMVQRFVVTELPIHRGEAVQAGDPLCELADYSELYIEGRAFEQDADELVRAANAGRNVSAVLENGGGNSAELQELEISHVANEVDRDSRALHFYVRLPNTVVRDAVRSDGRHFLTWRFKPGQRMQVRVPVERWDDVIVLPVAAVADEGPEAFVFVENGDHFDRRPVHVRHRDQQHAVIANDGSLYPGETVALTGAHQLQMALKNKAGGGVDPHAGHTH